MSGRSPAAQKVLNCTFLHFCFTGFMQDIYRRPSVTCLCLFLSEYSEMAHPILSVHICFTTPAKKKKKKPLWFLGGLTNTHAHAHILAHGFTMLCAIVPLTCTRETLSFPCSPHGNYKRTCTYLCA